MSQVTDDPVSESTLRELHEMAGTVAVKGKLLRQIIDELLRLRSAPSPLDEGMRESARRDIKAASDILKGAMTYGPNAIALGQRLYKLASAAACSASPLEPAAGKGDL